VSTVVSLTDQMGAAEFLAKVERGEALGEIELAFLTELLEREGDDLLEAIRPWRRP
jgi:hypothetical protein